ncbi:hypothetical protein CVT24_001006 [Panaeolus cyanescens]|uniref:Hydrophobin n=1 Tax=Panaeolus cyanescens TaxID=181874 RepID=A0A409YCI6_9AGAR|nr:hypothetical protein CVT24_001006 [Panaeolus cyanescens]
MVEATSETGISILALLGYPLVPGAYVAGSCYPITYYGASNTVCPGPNPPLCCGRDEANGYVVADCVIATY